MIIFEDQLARIVEILPPLTSGSLSQSIKFGWGTEEVLTKYLTLSGKASFPLIWLVEAKDKNDEREPSVTRNARIIFLYESQAPNEFNPYQHENDYKVILQPILDNFLIALNQSMISRYDDKNFRTKRVKNYSMREETKKSLVFICNAIVLEATITFSGINTCINQNIQFN